MYNTRYWHSSDAKFEGFKNWEAALIGPVYVYWHIIEQSSLVTSLCAPPGEKQFGELSRISWAYYPKAVSTNEIARSVIIT